MRKDQNPEIGINQKAIIIAQFAKCRNGTTPFVCKDQATIDAAFNSYTLYMYYPKLFVNPNDYEKEVSFGSASTKIVASATLKKEIEVVL
mmetsp:Transcript_15559/g.21720  ORF Transcript_15559/g.21720 Transcript_15559/m.21720 type:complete len:90 (+) Transcript_15559:292-561(+)